MSYSKQNGRGRGGQSRRKNDRMINVIIIVCVLLVVAATAVCVLLQSGGDETVLPPQVPASPSEVSPGDVSVSGSDAMEVSPGEFTVTVTGADGVYSRTGVASADAVTLTVAGQDAAGFGFTLADAAASISGTAVFIDADKAMYETAGGAVYFTFSNGMVTVYYSALGAPEGLSHGVDGQYITGAPQYIEDASRSDIDASVRESAGVVAALQALVPADDLALMNSVLATGSNPSGAGSAELGYDKDGRQCIIDSELGAVKYEAFVAGAGERVILICTNDAKVYVGICDGASFRYYTNDPAYSATAPKCISGTAAGTGMELEYC